MIMEEKKKRRKPYSSKTYTTGDPMLNLAFFNKCMGTDYIEDDKEAEKAADDMNSALTDGAGSESSGGIATDGDVSGGGEGFGEALTEAKRDVRRYYIRPQNIFCANKVDVIKALIDVGNNNCSIYTLKNLEDNDDIHKLTSKDIIYYYDDGILYDKNKVKVMDYDLYIKHEEERKHFTGDPNKVSDSEFNKAYADRITDRSTDVDEELNMKSYLNESINIETLKTKIEAATSESPVYLGYNFEHNDVIFVGTEVYADTEWYAYKENDNYILEWIDNGDDGAKGNIDCLDFKNIEALIEYISGMEFKEGILAENYTPDTLEETFNLDFPGINAFGESVSPKYTCCICGETFEGYGNNPTPYKDKGTCCDACNLKFVIPARLAQYQAEYNLDN